MTHRLPCRRISVILVALVLLSPLASALDDQAILISSPGCTKCAAAEGVLEGVLTEYPDVKIVNYLVYSEEGRKVIREHNVKGGVPAIVIGDDVIRYKDYHGDESLLEEMIRSALASDAAFCEPSCEPLSEDDGSRKGPLESGEKVEQTERAEQSPNRLNGEQVEGGELGEQDLNASTLSPMTVFVAGLLAGFNPCLLAVLAFLTAAVISSSGRRRDLFLMVVSFSFGIFAMYYIFGAGLLRVLQEDTMATGFKLCLSFLLLALGMVHVEDARRLKNGSKSLFKASWSHKYIESAISRGKLSTYFLLGALFSLVKAPCVGAVYIVVLGLISDEGYSAGALYLLLYNLGVILPVILLGGTIALGMSPSKVDDFRTSHRAGIRLVTGLTLIALAPLVYWQVV